MIDEVPAAFKAKSSEFINKANLTGHYEATNHHGQEIVLETTRALVAGDVLDLRGSMKTNIELFK